MSCYNMTNKTWVLASLEQEVWVQARNQIEFDLYHRIWNEMELDLDQIWEHISSFRGL